LIEAISATIDFNTSALVVVSPPVETEYVPVCLVPVPAAISVVKSTIDVYLPEVMPVVVPTEYVTVVVPWLVKVGAAPVAEIAVNIGTTETYVPVDPTLLAGFPLLSRNLSVITASSPCTYEALSQEAVTETGSSAQRNGILPEVTTVPDAAFVNCSFAVASEPAVGPQV